MSTREAYGAETEPEWTYASDLADFHAVWRTRLEHSGFPSANGTALLPYVDALAFLGASWGVDPGAITLLLHRADGQFVSGAGAVHPPAHGSGASVDWDSALVDWSAWRSGAEITHRADGLRLLVAGPVTVTPACLRCHNYPEGAVAGALIYPFFEIPDD